MRLDFFRPFLTFDFADGPLQHRCIELETDRVDVAALLSAEQIARPAQFQVERGNLEPCAQVRKFLQCRQPAPRQGRQLNVSRHEQVCIRPPIRTSDPSAQLVEFRESVPVRPVDDHGVA